MGARGMHGQHCQDQWRQLPQHPRRSSPATLQKEVSPRKLSRHGGHSQSGCWIYAANDPRELVTARRSCTCTCRQRGRCLHPAVLHQWGSRATEAVTAGRLSEWTATHIPKPEPARLAAKCSWRQCCLHSGLRPIAASSTHIMGGGDGKRRQIHRLCCAAHQPSIEIVVRRSVAPASPGC